MTLAISLDLPSIHDLAPLEEGGAVARTGFAYQDHVAAHFCIKMLRDAHLKEVWCETEDDITLIWDTGAGPLVEFVQVKADDLPQLWSVAKLTAGDADSIVAKSLSHDRCKEECCFRIWTRIGVHPVLRLLLEPRNDPSRGLDSEGMRKLHSEVCQSLGDTVSERGRSASHWVADTVWEIGESESAMFHANSFELEAYLEEIGEPLFSDQREELYNHILLKIQRSSFPKWKEGGKKKKLLRGGLCNWLLAEIAKVKGMSSTKGGESLAKKMTVAHIATDVVANANDMRLQFRARTISPQYQQESELRAAEQEVAATLQELLAKLDAGSITDSGVQFHSRCLTAVQNIKAAYPNVDFAFLQGALYTVTDRCRHRFLPATT